MKIQQKMGYDRSITMFSPDGRLLQVEYAKKTVRQGSTAIGVVCKDGVVLVADKRIVGKLVVPEAIEKMFKIDEHIAATASGIISDARVLIERAQVKAQQHKVTYDTAIDILDIVKDITSLKQICTQSAGLRPFGVSLLIGGVDNDGGPKLFMTDPTGIFFRYKAAVIGEGEPEIEKLLQKKYKPTMNIEEGIALSIQSLKEFLGPEFSLERLDIAYITIQDKKMKKVAKDTLKNVLNKVK
ncbi:MAG: archaeal proteasome endopeptidase complex subunit alpha [Nanoarchaeota archaeon]|nr:archaeal proteasome endopeptidase complex subunit alpha [Nanoarchaeota archaeon]